MEVKGPQEPLQRMRVNLEAVEVLDTEAPVPLWWVDTRAQEEAGHRIQPC